MDIARRSHRATSREGSIVNGTSQGVDLDTEFDVSQSDVSAFEKNGFVRLRGVLDGPTIQRFEPEITSKVLDLNTMHLPMEERSTYDKAFLQVTNLRHHSAVVDEFVRSRRLAQIAADLLGTDGVRLYADQALYKEPSGGLTPWHADQYYWPLSSDRAVTVWVPLQETPLEMGALEFAAESHNFAYGRDLPISDESERQIQAAMEADGFRVDRAPYDLGDVSYHLGWTFHRASPNRSETARRVMTVIYVDADIRPVPATNHFQQESLDVTMAGVPIGEPLDTPDHPLLFSR
jgi:ectoine hydroxylase-related dioxygenase (phytanoyl-CoA dioxygenase family)